jgi:hypothetical protein
MYLSCKQRQQQSQQINDAIPPVHPSLLAESASIRGRYAAARTAMTGGEQLQMALTKTRYRIPSSLSLRSQVFVHACCAMLIIGL